MIRIGFGVMNIRFNFGTDRNFKAIIKDIHIAIGTVGIRAVGIVIIARGRAREVKGNIPSIKRTRNRLKANSRESR
jgi:hypothetical protein